MSRQLSKKEAREQQVAAAGQEQNQYARDVETREQNASASGSAGLNLNLFGALSGALSSKSKKTTHHNPDGSSTSVEDRHDKAAANGIAAGRGTAFAKADANQGAKHTKSREIGQGQSQAKMVEGRKEVDHLGIEDA
ncbi:hypothetical protein BU24DRAFT_428385 [Aaosphaeria arxii CBS 175.79]|uniref:Uncharacterized protein n=1 Tax=Aaosphaeria arxii CBS 175.79 TaxID=1450172 RepID=A0A6A5X979_9PLEO|nr:uncharacterized protein BU24DRAFT_428385 [Aaosphaeria arxii CBS 175.79]KAF2009493.1 hypothetical protein BU24DRAFT_428385 [Aaosphaeria arxii CBS 175.79]